MLLAVNGPCHGHGHDGQCRVPECLPWNTWNVEGGRRIKITTGMNGLFKIPSDAERHLSFSL